MSNEKKPEGIEGYSLDTGLFPFDIFEYDPPTLKVKGGYELLALPPIGFVYWQLPGKSAPATLWPAGTWTNISSDFAGDFFRAEGGDASTFESGEQADQFEAHTHSMPVKDGTTSGSSTEHVQRANPGAGGTGTIAVGAASGSTGTETRPVNRTIRIWERTA